VDIPGKALDDHEFQKRLGQENDWISQTSKSQISSFKFFDYAPLVFQRIRSRNGITEDEYMKSLGPEQILNSFWTNNYETLYELCSSGQSGSLFYYTKDRKYMMKTIPKREYLKMREILKPYYNHVKKNNDSLLIRFYGLH
jgi:1-phosphatidylinositol-4-phosphate 5-kinase